MILFFPSSMFTQMPREMRMYVWEPTVSVKPDTGLWSGKNLFWDINKMHQALYTATIKP